MSALCRMGWHAWGRWDGCLVADVIFGKTQPPRLGQVRSCRRCNKEQTR